MKEFIPTALVIAALFGFAYYADRYFPNPLTEEFGPMPTKEERADREKKRQEILARQWQEIREKQAQEVPIEVREKQCRELRATHLRILDQFPQGTTFEYFGLKMLVTDVHRPAASLYVEYVDARGLLVSKTFEHGPLETLPDAAKNVVRPAK